MLYKRTMQYVNSLKDFANFPRSSQGLTTHTWANPLLNV